MHKIQRSRPEKTTRPVKLFTLAQANATLPLVRRIAQDLAEAFRRIAGLETQARSTPAGPNREALRAEYHRCVDQLRELSEEISDIGCELKDPRIGLIDFPSMHDSRVVYLCWKLGEDRVSHWHETSEGYAGRREMDESFVA